MGGDVTLAKQKIDNLTIQTPGLEPSRRRNIEELEAAKRKRELEALAGEKQAELEEILLQLSQATEKNVAIAEHEEDDSEDTYDSLYGEGQEESGEEEELQNNERLEVRKELAAIRTGVAGPKSNKAPTASMKKSKLPSMEKEKRIRHTKKDSTQKKKTATQRKEDLESESSSGDEMEEVQVKAKEPAKLQEMELLVYQGWEDPSQSTRLMERRALGRIYSSPFILEIYEAEPPKKFQTPRFTV